MSVSQKEQKRVRELDDKEFEKEWTAKAKELEALKEELKFYSQDSQARAAEQRASQLAETLSDDEKQALLQSLQAEGAKSEEKGMGDD